MAGVNGTLVALSRFKAHNNTVYWDILNDEGYEDELSPSTKSSIIKANIILLSIILLLAISGNMCVAAVLIRRKDHLSLMQWFIFHLSLADLFVAMFHVLPQLLWEITRRFQGNDFLCRLVKYTQVVAMYVSTYVMVMLAIDRYLSLCHANFRQRSAPWRGRFMIATAWGLSMLFSIPQVFLFSYQEPEEYPGTYECWATFRPAWTEKLYVTSVAVAVFILPFIILAYCYGRISYVLWSYRCHNSKHVPHRPHHHHAPKTNTKKTYAHLQNGQSSNRGTSLEKSSTRNFKGRSQLTKLRVRSQRDPGAISSAKMRTIKLSLTIVICYVICWTPFFVAQLWSTYDRKAHIRGPAMLVIMRLASLNSCSNPFIYLIFSTLWRQSKKQTIMTSFMNLASDHSKTESSSMEMSIIRAV